MNILFLVYRIMDCVALNLLFAGLYKGDISVCRLGYVKVIGVRDLCILHAYFCMLTIGNMTARNFVVILDKFNIAGLCFSGKSHRNRPLNSLIVNLYFLLASACRRNHFKESMYHIFFLGRLIVGV
jgi:hypothetical protein